MAQHDYVISNGTGAAVRSDLNNALAAIVSQNSGATAPSPTYAFQFWADTTAGVLKLRNSANSAWITLFQLDGEWTTLPIENGTAAAPSIYFKDSGTDTGFYSPGTDQVAISTGGTGRLFINSSGSVGIGTSSPANGRLNVSSTTNQITLDTTDTATYGRLDIGHFTNGTFIGTFAGSNTASDLIRFGTGGTERARIDSAGRWLLGTSTARANYFNTTLTAGLQVEGTGGSTARAGLTVVNNDSVNNPAYIVLGRSGAASLGSNTSVASGDWIGSLSFQGTDGSKLVEAAAIQAWVDATPGAGDMPGRLVFSTTADGASSPTERMRISQNGVVTVKNGAVAEIGTLTDAATITPDFAANCNFTVTLGGNRTLANPTNVTAGQSGSLFIVQDGTGNRTLSWGSNWDWTGGTAPTLTTTANAVDRVDYVCRSATSIQAVYTSNYS